MNNQIVEEYLEMIEQGVEGLASFSIENKSNNFNQGMICMFHDSIIYMVDILRCELSNKENEFNE